MSVVLVGTGRERPDKAVGSVSERGDDPGGYGVIGVGTDV